MKLFDLMMILATFIIYSISLHHLDEFEQKFMKFNYPEKGFYEVDVGFSNNSYENFHPLLFADINNDKFTDIIGTFPNRSVIGVMEYSSSNHNFNLIQKATIHLEYGETIHSLIILKLAPGRYIELALIVNSGSKTFIKFWKGDLFFNFKFTNMEIEVRPNSSPFAFDIDGDRRLEILFNSINNERKIASVNSQFDNFNITDFFTFFPESSGRNLFFADANGHAFIDLNYDCVADLFLINEDNDNKNNIVYELWSVEKWYRPLYRLKSSYTLKRNEFDKMSLPVFHDFNNDGSLEMLYAIEEYDAIYLKLINLPLGPNNSDDFCKQSQTYPVLEKLFGDYQYSSVKIKATKSYGTIYKSDFEGKVLRIGDVDLDGLTDVIMTFNIGSKSNTMLLHNNNFSSFDSFKISEKTTDDILGAFFDLEENGRLDIFIINNNKSPKIKFYLNYNYLEYYYLKIFTFPSLDNRCLYPGAFASFVHTNMEGENLIRSGSQPIHSGSHFLELPFSHFGIGKSNNYLEFLTVGFPLNWTENTQYWSPIIPNSQLVIIPGEDESSNWNIELYVKPKNLIAICIFDSAIIILLLIILIIIQVCNKYYDRLGRRSLFIIPK